jgi:glutathione S-transferase
VRKGPWVGQELGIAVECEDWGAGFRSTHSPDFLALDPDGPVPARAGDSGMGMETHADDENFTRADGALPFVAAAC